MVMVRNLNSLKEYILMKILSTFPLLIAALVVAGCSGPTGGSSSSDATGPESTADSVTFASAVQPIFQERCAKCHIQGSKGDLSLESRESTLAGGEEGSDIVPGDSAGSLLYQMVSGQAEKRMPPKGDPLSDDEIATIQSWIDAGAN